MVSTMDKVPPEITGNSSYGNYTDDKASDGTVYFDHSAISGFNDIDCVPCHDKNSAPNISALMHDVSSGRGGPDCISCHNVGGPLSGGLLVNFTAMDDANAIHKNLDDPTVDPAPYSALNKKCWVCHGNGAKPADDHPANYKTPFVCTDCHKK
ncbi:MAG: hypothetical protein E4G94_08480, partial [ANME-2 cluster archaeon]